jgi:hypothetical protein
MYNVLYRVLGVARLCSLPISGLVYVGEVNLVLSWYPVFFALLRCRSLS